ncbi:MAG: hypothetical protein U9P14_03565 [Gemmatimonadota bacterium]|nr:hypothetical protein [Gemmatimonadota bacterium]
MTTLRASDTRIPAKVFNDVAIRFERVMIERRDGEKIALISSKELELFETLENYYDNMLADQALAEMEALSEKPVSLEQVKAELGL